MTPLTFSIIIPSFNEGQDIRLSIESALTQDYPPVEVLVVDDSTDGTPEIISEYSNRGVILVRGSKTGCCGARNLGMKSATGDIVVLLNADVNLPSDFLSKIEKHYDSGADFVLVESKVFNEETTWSRFVEAQHKVNYGGRKDIFWTEGFSCRKSAAEKVGYIPGNFAITFCRDWFLGKAMSESGFKKVVDFSIVVTHKAPDTFLEYYKVRKARGRFSALTQIHLLRKHKKFIFLKFLLKDFLLVLKFFLIFPAVFGVIKITSKSPKKAKDFLGFFVAYLILEYARAVGEWEGFLIATRVDTKL